MTEICSLGSSPTIDFLIGQGLVQLDASQSVEVRWLLKARIASSAFTTGDFLRMRSLIAGGSARYIALLMNLIAFNDKVIAQMVFIAEAPKGEEEDPTVTWDALKAASHAPLRDCTFADVRHLSLTLLHPTARRGSPI